MTQATGRHPVRVMVVDDHQVVREGLVSMLGAAQEVQVVGLAADPEEAIQEARILNPDVVLLDIRLSGACGVDVCQALSEQAPESRVIMLTSFEEETYLLGAVQAGAWGYLVKTGSREDIVAAIEAVAGGRRLLRAPARRTSGLEPPKVSISFGAGQTAPGGSSSAPGES